MRSKFVLLMMLALGTNAHALNLNGYMDEVIRKHRGLEAQRAAKEAAMDKREGGDLVLSPVFTLKGSYLGDDKQPNQLGAKSSQAREYSATLAKKFSTGTSVALSAKMTGVENIDDPNAPSALLGLQPNYRKFSTGSLGIALTQSLWKDFFGHGTRVRRDKDMYTADLETAAADLQSRQILVDAENAFWDYNYKQDFLQLKRAALARAQKIEAWVRRRAGDGIAEKADLLNAQSLVALRRLDVARADDDYTAARRLVRDYLELKDGESLPELNGDVNKVRNLKKLIGYGGEGRVVSLDAWISTLKAKLGAAVAEDVRDQTRADLVLQGAYNTNSYEVGGNVQDASNKWTSAETPTKAISLTWTYIFDDSAKRGVVNAAKASAASAQFQAERAARDGETRWQEFQRRHTEMTQMVETAATVSRLQNARAKAQEDRLARGRTVTSDVIQSEQDAAEAELRLTELQAGQRKLESSARYFVVIKE